MISLIRWNVLCLEVKTATGVHSFDSRVQMRSRDLSPRPLIIKDLPDSGNISIFSGVLFISVMDYQTIQRTKNQRRLQNSFSFELSDSVICLSRNQIRGPEPVCDCENWRGHHPITKTIELSFTCCNEIFKNLSMLSTIDISIRNDIDISFWCPYMNTGILQNSNLYYYSISYQ